MLDLGKAYTLADLILAAQETGNTFGEQVWFRGHEEACDWKLLPSAYRRHPILESEFVNHFRLKAPSLSSDCPEQKNYSAWLPLMQHYGLPTRLLDWSESLLVAIFFALNQKSTTTDAVLWMLSPGNFNRQSVGYFIPFLTDERVQPLVTDAFKVNSDSEKYSLAVIAPRTDRRMAAQLGNYTIHGNRTPIEELPNTDNYLAKITIPSEAFSQIKGDLLTAGIRRSILFPDLSNLAKEISELKALGSDNEDLEAV